MAEEKTHSYQEIFFPEKDFKIRVIQVNDPTVDKPEDFPKLFHEEIEIKLFLEGRTTLMIDNKTVVAEPGDIVVINPYQIHSNIRLGEERVSYHLIMLSLDFFSRDSAFPDLRHIFIKERSGIKTHIRGNRRLAEIIQNIVAELYEKREMYHSVINHLVSELFLLLLRDCRKKEALSLPSDKHIRLYETVYPALNRIRSGFNEKISIDELSEICGVSKYHFCRIFREVTGVSALEYQLQYRLRIADIFLKNTDKSISEIAESCGFDDNAYFSRCYKKHMGVSPREKRAILSK